MNAPFKVEPINERNITMKKLVYGIVGLLAASILAACGGGGSSPVVYSKAVTKAYLFCAMSSNSKIVSVDSSILVPAGFDVIYTPQIIGDSGTVYGLNTDYVSAPLFSSIEGSFDTSSSRSLKVSFTQPAFPNLSSNIKNNGREIATLTLPFITKGVKPLSQLPDSDASPTVGKEKTNGDRDYLTGCKVNYVTTFK